MICPKGAQLRYTVRLFYVTTFFHSQAGFLPGMKDTLERGYKWRQLRTNVQ
jgi:hypothetical protein